ncbi:response regulator [Pseudobacteriovorax antillogorgiicola]|uniref:Response regulator receiver domain-containing protein n=1 Tax=Pseudobacteriovorax antillogorgiicola TaxID=1513793 RepID=A0A1Y6BCX0_9BACT|nr:response regulator [Pseudobacteriovorax antillogorgiicola]TCS58509.1 response regulator receiver domain-containing protein [Pseudobacteriovorax antillogorgiicola]SME98137.1 Response regulator receiver domain-containing protein [Pseudobacteriovorax antillogorgiicola]
MEQKVLVIDDDFDILLLICDILESHNYTCEAVSNPSEVLNMASEQLTAFDLIFTDIKMPELDGFDLISILKDRGVEVPVIAVTGLPDEGQSLFETKLSRRRCSPDYIVRKPFTFDQISQPKKFHWNLME